MPDPARPSSQDALGQTPWDAPQHWRIDEEICTGCVLCTKACPPGAIRVRRGIAKINPQICVDCGECYRVCPHSAVRGIVSQWDDLWSWKYPVAAASAVLYSQFGFGVTPNQILLSLKKLGFKEVVDLAWLCELASFAYQEYLHTHPEVRPGISPVCPVVVRLIVQRFPSLVEKVIPMVTPRVLAAKGLKERIARRHGWPMEEVGVFGIWPCPARLYCHANPLVVDRPYLDGIVCIQDAYGPILQALREKGKEETIQKCSGQGLAWAMSGGEAHSVAVGHTLAVSGFDEVVKILEMLEAGRLNDLSFVEAMACRGGCIGGPLVVENRYRAQSCIRAMAAQLGPKTQVDRDRVARAMSQGLFDWETHPDPPRPAAPQDSAAAILRLREINALSSRLPGGECGACGAPDCATFAADVVDGEAREEDCFFVARRKRVRGETEVPAKGGDISWNS